MGHTPTIVDGELYPSVTTILAAQPKVWLKKWQDKWGPLAVRKAAASNAIGTEFHRCVEDYIETGWCSSQSLRITLMFASFKRWADRVDVSIDATECKVISRKYKYAGTLDAVGLWNGKLYVFDWKTSSGIYPDMALQLVAYAKAYEEQTGQRVDMGCIVLVSKDKPKHRLTVKEYPMDKALFNQFLRRLQDYNKAQKVAA